MIQKRFQYRTRDGIKWSEWFNWPHKDWFPEIQLKGFKGAHLYNEYREV